MYVPNYIPDPSEVPGNITERPYLERLTFIRRVCGFHFASILLVAGASFLPGPNPPAIPALWACILYLLFLSLVRTLGRGRPQEHVLSGVLLLPFLIALGPCIRSWTALGFQVWPPVYAAGGALIYSRLCGRDFSFVGQFILSLIFSSFLVALISTAKGLPPSEAAEALAWNAGFLAFFEYDLASLLARRRPGEEIGAVVDLYRDIFNLFGYIERCLKHWQRHKIWTLPWQN
ncbi:MAG: Bax inhibitor-1 family protein [Armatimonadetes bacterium]|nr:Bax inhibitor-1 family protein [Armatimonadota bacterium]